MDHQHENKLEILPNLQSVIERNSETQKDLCMPFLEVFKRELTQVNFLQ